MAGESDSVIYGRQNMAAGSTADRAMAKEIAVKKYVVN